MVEGRAVLCWGVSKHIEDYRRAAKVGYSMFGDETEYDRRLDFSQTYLRAAGRHNSPGIGPAATMEHRQGPQIDAIESKSEAEAVAER
jgi:hypothetical protein